MHTGEDGEAGGRSNRLNQNQHQRMIYTMSSPWIQNQRPAKRPHMEDDGERSTDTGATGAYGMIRSEMGELAIQLAQMASMHDQRIRELETVVMRKVIIPAAGRCGQRFIAEETK